MTINRQLELLGDYFRGLWRNCVLIDTKDEYIKEAWTVTFIYRGQYVETPEFSTPEAALDKALGKLGLRP